MEARNTNMKKFTNVRLKGEKEPVSILVEDGKITKIAKEIPQECETIDVGGNLVIPPYVDPHLHLDYVFTADMGEQNGSGTLFEGIQRWSESKGNMTVEQMKARIYSGIRKRCFMVCRQSVHILMSQIRLLPD
jgi:cytosine deaminase